MYGKFFASAFTGSMMAAGAEVFAVWSYVIANAANGHVELNPRFLAAVIGSTPERMQTAIDALCAPDIKSRSEAKEGRRLVREGEYLYSVTNHEKYRAIRNEDDRREYNRDAKRRERARTAMSHDVSLTVIEVSAESAHTEGEAEGETKKQIQPTKARRRPKVSVESVSPETLVAAGFDLQQAEDFLACKIDRKAPLTARAWADHQREAAKAGWSAVAAAEKVMAKTWKGFEAKYVADERAPSRQSDVFAGAL